MPDSTRWARTNDLFHAAVAKPAAERAAFLSEECGSDAALRVEVESLLAAHREDQTGVRPGGVVVGSRLGDYEVTGFIAAGGMGEVYRARDRKLGRDVALKILPSAFVADPDRRARFQREAKTLAALNHPRIAQIYGLEMTSGVQALVMELVEGEDLSTRIARGPIPLNEAVPIARQIAEALQAAHEQGIIHRDLKPANIKITPDDVVKVLDFGLAKLAHPEGTVSPSDVTAAPTTTSPAMTTGVGVLLVLAAYMSPEQAKGRPADKRSDIWSFGCVLYEMLARSGAFQGDDVTETLALVLMGEPDWSALPSDLPTSIRTLLRACLEKDRRQRLADISGALFVLGHHADLVPIVAPASPSPTSRVPAWRHIAAVAALVLTMAALAATGVWLALTPDEPSSARFFVSPADNTMFWTGGGRATTPVISPDGRTVAFTARDTAGMVMVWVRPIDSLAAQPLAGTDDAQFPFWSPDSQFIAYFARDKLVKIAARGGPPQTLCSVIQGRGGTWSRDGQIVYGTNGGSLSRVSSAGGQPSEVTRLMSGQTDHRFPSFLPDGQHVLYYVQASENTAGIYSVSLGTGKTQRLGQADSGGVYDWRSGLLLFVRQGTLLAQSFDPSQLAFVEESFPIAERVESSAFAGVTAFSVSDTGVLAYGIGPAPAGAAMAMRWIDRQGKVIGNVGPPGPYRGIDLAPEGNRVVAHRHDGEGGDVWVTEIVRGTTSRITFDAARENSSPIWSPDASRIVFSVSGGAKSGLYAKLSNGAGGEERLLESDVQVVPQSWAPDGSSIVYVRKDPKGEDDLWMLPLSGDRKPVPLVVTPFVEAFAQISPDGKWLAYGSNETGHLEIYVRPFPTGDGKWQISIGGGLQALNPRWRGDGRELFYQDNGRSGGRLMAVDVKTTGSVFEAGSPKPLFDSASPFFNHGVQTYHLYAVSTDGQRFLIPRPAASVTQDAASPVVIVLNWAEGVRH